MIFHENTGKECDSEEIFDLRNILSYAVPKPFWLLGYNNLKFINKFPKFAGPGNKVVKLILIFCGTNSDKSEKSMQCLTAKV